MQALSATAVALGNDITLPGASAADAGTAMLELAKAGLTVDEAMAGHATRVDVTLLADGGVEVVDEGIGLLDRRRLDLEDLTQAFLDDLDDPLTIEGREVGMGLGRHRGNSSKKRSSVRPN